MGLIYSFSKYILTCSTAFSCNHFCHLGELKKIARLVRKVNLLISDNWPSVILRTDCLCIEIVCADLFESFSCTLHEALIERRQNKILYALILVKRTRLANGDPHRRKEAGEPEKGNARTPGGKGDSF